MSQEKTILDFRSDTITRPCEGMRRAMAEAAVGDDVYREDPTVLALEERCAELTGKEAALFMPTGSMGNGVALNVWGKEGSAVVLEERAHIFHWELAAVSALSGLMPKTVPGDRDGCPDFDAVEKACRKAPYYGVPAGVISVEVTHNLAGGTLPAMEKLKALYDLGRERSIPVHMDGARVFNAAVALGVPVKDITAHCDSVMFCFSKGLGAPIGSMLCGPADFMAEALAARKRFGGGMRQVGILAAAGQFALDHNVEALKTDHTNARLLAEGLNGVPGLSIDPDAFPTNILFVDTEEEKAARWADVLGKHGLMINALSPSAIRFCTYKDVGEAEVKAAVALAEKVSSEI